MSGLVKKLVRDAITDIINSASSSRELDASNIKHREKIHFIPVQYRVLGGLIQSLNIRFGNVIERIIQLVIENDSTVASVDNVSKRVLFRIPQESINAINQYISEREDINSPEDFETAFNDLCLRLIQLAQNPTGIYHQQTYDVDGLFRLADGRYIYLEVKYNDDHDTGKFVDINRKFLMTYSGLIGLLGIQDVGQIFPIIYCFNPKKRYAPLFVPSKHIYRGRTLFDDFFQIDFDEIDQTLKNIAEDPEILKLFDDIYQRIRYGT